MDDLTAAPRTDPASLYRGRDELYAEDMFIAALNGFDFFTWLDAHPSAVDDIAKHFGFHPRPVDVMTTLFVARGLLERDGGTLRLTAEAREHLVASSPWFLGPYFPTLTDRPIALDLVEVLRSDRPANFASRKNEPDWHKAMETERVAEEFTAAMDCRGRLLAQALANQLDLGGRRRLLDVAGGSGIYACALAAQFRVTGRSSKTPSTIAQRDRNGIWLANQRRRRRHAQRRLPQHDVHLWSNVLHDWDVPIVCSCFAPRPRTSGRRRDRDSRRVLNASKLAWSIAATRCS